MIEFQGVHKTFPNAREDGEEIHAVKHLDLTVHDGETHCLIGTSGCGKTTTLRMVNRLEEPTRGCILLGGEAIADLDIIRLRRRIGYVIQTGGLFPHMTVARNVGVMCELEGWNRDEIRERVSELLRLVNLPAEEFAGRYPADLSGGQRQRVGVARALALDPGHLLMDEPFGALDPITRTQIHDEFQQLTKEVHKTILLVTHDLGEAFKLGDRISLMHEGSLVQTGTADDLKNRPASSLVEQFLAGHPDVGGDQHGSA